MNLRRLCPTEPTDLVQLTDTLRRHNSPRAALPASLPEPLLLSVARDLRCVEDAEENASDEEKAWLAAPMMLVFSLMLGFKPSQKSEKELTVSESTLYASLQAYQWAVEREIVTRITGKGGGNDEEALMQSLQEAHQH